MASVGDSPTSTFPFPRNPSEKSDRGYPGSEILEKPGNQLQPEGLQRSAAQLQES